MEITVDTYSVDGKELSQYFIDGELVEQGFPIKEKDGYKYCSVPNIYANDNVKMFLSSRCSQAIKAIEEGYGDTIFLDDPFGIAIEVIRFVDRKKGEEERAKFLKENSNLKYLYFVRLNSFGIFYTEDDKCIYVDDIREEAKRFDTVEEIEKFISYLKNDAKKEIENKKVEERTYFEKMLLSSIQYREEMHKDIDSLFSVFEIVK